MTVAALFLMLGGQVLPAEAPPVVHAQLLDEVGVAGRSDAPAAGMTARHRNLPSGSYAEVTALDSGRTIVLLVEQDPSLPPGNVVLLSDAARKALSVADQAQPTVRIRPAVPSPVEQAAIRAGSEVTRLPAPQFLLAALRRRLPVAAQPAPPPVPPTTSAPVAAPPPKLAAKPATPRPAARGRWFVQVATLSDPSRAAALAKSVDGVVRSAGRLYRVQAGPFATRAAAETARASIARRGFGDARIIAQD